MAPDPERQPRNVAQPAERAVAVHLGWSLMCGSLRHDQSQSLPGYPLPIIHTVRQLA
jgi:hypothetical protein